MPRDTRPVRPRRRQGQPDGQRGLARLDMGTTSQCVPSPPLFLSLRARDLTSAATITAPAAVRSGRARVRVPPRPARDDQRAPAGAVVPPTCPCASPSAPLACLSLSFSPRTSLPPSPAPGRVRPVLGAEPHHDLRRAPGARHPPRRLCAARPCGARQVRRRVPGPGRQVSARPLERSLFHPAFLSPRSLARTLALADRRSPRTASRRRPARATPTSA